MLVGLVVLLGLGTLAVLMFAYLPRTSMLQAKDETIRQLRDQLSKLSQRAAEDALSDRQERTEIVADREEREQSIVNKYEKKLADACKERDLWRHRSRFAEKRAKVFAKLADNMAESSGDTEKIRKDREELQKELQQLNDLIKKIDVEILDTVRAA